MSAKLVSLKRPQDEVAVAVIVPAYKQPGLLPEALDAVLKQRADFAIGTVVIDDGCPFAETRAAALTFARQYPSRVCYFRTANSGLSAARNAGIAFALRTWPSVRALYMLDSDNRLRPDFLARAMTLLEQSAPHVGWIYPDFDMFGVPINHSTCGPYSLLMHLMENTCEAGSLIRREVFDAGQRFDESMRTGQEDWNFWLQAASEGFRGRHLPRSGFQYRKRIESMLSDGDAQRATTVAAMRRKHQALTHPRAVIALAQDEMPDYALYLDDGRVRQVADPFTPHEGPILDAETARGAFVEAMERPAARFFPPVMCFADPDALAVLTRNKLVRNVFWRARILLRDCQIVTMRIGVGEPAQLGLRADAEASLEGACAIFARTGAAAAWLHGMDRSRIPAAQIECLHVTLPAGTAYGGASRGRTPVERFDEEIARLTDLVGERAEGLPLDWRHDNRLARSAEAALETLIGCRVAYPHRKKPGVRDFGVILPRCEFGGIERGKGNYAAVLRARGWRPHLFVTKPTTVYLSPLAFDAFESVNFVSIDDAEKIHPGQHYFGMWTSDFAKRPEAGDLVGLLGNMDAVINNHSFAAHAVASRLRRFGVNMTVGVHMTERTPVGNPLGTPHSILGYEHGYDRIIVISDMLREWCIGQGVPEEKLHLVRNAPSYPSGRYATSRSLKAKKRRDGPLNVLFLGRLDRQKGLDRMAEIIRRTKGDAVAWRLVGKAVIEDTGVELADAGIAIEPPVHTAEELDALYEWADVMILTSRFEGVPLSILEAQRAGCVALSTDVGAVREVVSHDIDGLVVPLDADEETIVGAFCAHLKRLAGDRRLVRTIGMRAARRGRRRRWDRHIQSWVESLEAACDAAEDARPKARALRET